ncbi:flagellar protein export ATPase FliI [Zhaonella formicivorans]|uniref:flagellar protein export ATPase FliI n=1 Tax=Zhaonella formicivorans TaxID=2528593 RepID=UPI0010E788B4|nr:flagellar protein export ATPase FliI [Zhaonella formicivorans]
MAIDLSKYREIVRQSNLLRSTGKVAQVIGLIVEVTGIKAAVGEICEILVEGQSEPTIAEVVGFKNSRTLLMPLGELGGIAPGYAVRATGKSHTIPIGPELLGQVLDGLGRPMQPGVELNKAIHYPVNNNPPDPLSRKRITEIMATGVKAIDAFLTCGKGQRVGIFAGSGVGKSTLLGMIARQSGADINVIGLVGERGREVLDFIERDLGPEGLDRSVVVVATSDQPALVRIKAAFVATAIAEYFRDQGQNVMLMMDSVTRFAMAQREVGLAIGEPPATKGYTPSVFALLPRLLERAGNAAVGSITALYTVLVDADDMNEPIADAVRGILDGHIVLSRELAAKNHYPAVDVLNSVSRLMAEIVSGEHLKLAGELRDLLASYQKVEDLINIGAYQKGSNPQVDAAIKHYPQIIQFLKQRSDEYVPFAETIRLMSEILNS